MNHAFRAIYVYFVAWINRICVLEVGILHVGLQLFSLASRVDKSRFDIEASGIAASLVLSIAQDDLTLSIACASVVLDIVAEG